MKRLWSTRRALPQNMGAILLCGWLVATGSARLLDIGNELLAVVLNVVAIVAGILLFFDR